MATIHGTLNPGEDTQVFISLDVRSAGVLHKGGTSEPIYATWEGPAVVEGEDTFTVLPGMRRWIPCICETDEPEKSLHLISAGAVAWEIES